MIKRVQSQLITGFGWQEVEHDEQESGGAWGVVGSALSGLARRAGSNGSHVFPERMLPLPEVGVVRIAWLC